MQSTPLQCIPSAECSIITELFRIRILFIGRYMCLQSKSDYFQMSNMVKDSFWPLTSYIIQSLKWSEKSRLDTTKYHMRRYTNFYSSSDTSIFKRVDPNVYYSHAIVILLHNLVDIYNHTLLQKVCILHPCSCCC